MAIRQRKKRKLGFRRADGKCGGFLNYFFFLVVTGCKKCQGCITHQVPIGYTNVGFFRL